MATYDLSKTIIPYLDRHLVFPLLAHLEPIYPKPEVYIAQYELARGTNMFDYAVSLFSKIYPDQEVPLGTQSMIRIFAKALMHPQSLNRNDRMQYQQMIGCSRKLRRYWMSSKTLTLHSHYGRTRIKI
jgi:hypothetical protein